MKETGRQEVGFWILWQLLGCGEGFRFIVSDWCCVSHFPIAGHSTWQKRLKEDALWFPISKALVHHDGECMGDSSVLGSRDMAESQLQEGEKTEVKDKI